ncbi:hypothetical protein O181_102245 [Austropuccinia psidii MF-1]|uniref:Uncharacterized protein n=1 Tax=Austropuccinia psidii MF-1 TaxID=1389203 RepID=A0A9Q3JFW9_9BASI|nr:hypothetical protein [Austropuccinia psidii MF-1]
MRPKGAKGGSHLAPKPQLDPPEPKLVTNPLDPKLANDLLDTNLAINPVGPIFGQGPPGTNISAMTSGNHQRPPDHLSKPSPQLMGNSFHSFMPSILKVAGVVHIWYYKPLCTIFAQQSNGDVFRTHFHLSISRSQNPTPISMEDYSAHQSDKLWQQSEDSSRIQTTCVCRSWVGILFKGPILNSYYIIAISCQGVKYFNTPWTTQFIPTGLIQSTCMALAQLGHFIFHCVNSITQFKFQDGQNCISRLGQYSQLIHLPGSVFQFFTYTGHLSAPGDFFPS